MPVLAIRTHNSLAAISNWGYPPNVIELIRERLPAPQEAKLRAWLAKPEYEILKSILTAGCQFAQAEALGEALAAVEKGDAMDLMSRASIVFARDYSTTKMVLHLLANQTEPFHIAKLKTATTNDNAIIPESED